jgi:cold shock CspA family protein
VTSTSTIALRRARTGPEQPRSEIVQGTVKEFDEASRSGSLLTDDRTEIGIDPASGDATQYRMLRFGQRVLFEVEEIDGRAVARSLRLVTFEP